MICPMKHWRSNYGNWACDEQNCAWWEEQEGVCVVRLISRVMTRGTVMRDDPPVVPGPTKGSVSTTGFRYHG